MDLVSELLDTATAAQYLGLQRNTLEVWRSAGRYNLPFVRVGRSIRYRRGDLDAWLTARTATQTGATNHVQPPLRGAKRVRRGALHSR
jgi:excisionase family DNA binding protein